jgi:hypothetical protein
MSAGAEPNFAAGAEGDFLEDGIAVEVVAGKRQQNVKHRGGERCAWFDKSVFHGSSVRVLFLCRYTL